MGADDFLQMDTDIVEPVMRSLAATGEDLDGRWQSCRAQVDSGEAGIGGDVLGQAFRGVYEGASRALRTTADELPGSLRTAAGNGMACCTDYAAADTRAAAAMPDAAERGV